MNPVNSSISTSYMAPSSNLDGSRRSAGDLQGAGSSFDSQLSSGVQTEDDQAVSESSVSASPQNEAITVQLVTATGGTEATNNQLGSLIDTSA